MYKGAYAQAPLKTSLELLGTRSWIRVDLPSQQNEVSEYRLSWSETGQKPDHPNVTVKPGTEHYYIQEIVPETTYTVWVDGYRSKNLVTAAKGKVITHKDWTLDKKELHELDINPSSKAVPKGMQLFWHDEFNNRLLNRNKWFVSYYSTIDHLRGEFEEDMRNDNLPVAAYTLNGKTIDLFVNDSLPVKVYDKKISSIQTYNWRTNENLLDNSRGGYFEVKVKRSSTGTPRGLNTAFWFDSPGPDLRYYLEQGVTLNGTTGIRPKGQVFEIDIFEYLNAQFVLHGHVNNKGEFQHNLATHIAKGYTHIDQWVTHGILWSPTAIKHYINGDLIKEYTDKHQIYSPNHFMNVLLGSYGAGGTVNMEVDYIRGYQWPLKDGNELPNPGFEDSGSLIPWEGTGLLTEGNQKNGRHAILLKPGEHVEQYVYLNNSTMYILEYWQKGITDAAVSVYNITSVSGESEQIISVNSKGKNKYTKKNLSFKTGKEFDDNMKTIRLLFVNKGTNDLYLDDINVKKE